MDAELTTEVEEVASVFTREEAALGRSLPAPDLGLWHGLICIIHHQSLHLYLDCFTSSLDSVKIYKNLRNSAVLLGGEEKFVIIIF